MTTVFTWVGYAAGTLTTLAFLPQVRQVWKTKSAEDLHIGTLVSFTVGITLWLIYGIAVKQMPVIVANAVTLGLQIAIIFLKMKYAGGAGKVLRKS
ncbi:MAG: SemiSWEET transporter [Candidatus Korobacteraceae bacterium]|jgi:MtN3 and saliva related transmembrane protein